MRYTETTKDDSAVSPVIGVILMVAITVILAAVIGTFVLGLGEQVEQNARAAVNADVDDSEDSVTLSLTTLDNSDYVLVRGAGTDFSLDNDPGGASLTLSSGSSVYLEEAGTTLQLNGSTAAPTTGTITVVAVIGDPPSSVTAGSGAAVTSDPPPESATTTTVQQVEYEFN